MLKKAIIRISILILSFAAAEAATLGLHDSPKHQAAERPYFSWLLIIITAAYLAAATAGYIKSRKKKYISDENIFYKAPFWAGVILVMNIINIVTAKAALLPVLYFPTLDRVFGTLFEDHALILKCVRYSAGILVSGVFGGLAAGFFMGIGVGFSKRMSYWINPVVRILGPIPSTAWIPILLVAFPTARAASAFIIGISVWFPTIVLTSSGISNIKNSYFEVASTLGANKLQQIFKIGVPAAGPSIFLGLFNGICASFISLMTAEMIGAKYGIGWYVNWQKEMMAYANVYAGLIVIAVLFYIVITVLFKVRDKALLWQKGVIKW